MPAGGIRRHRRPPPAPPATAPRLRPGTPGGEGDAGGGSPHAYPRDEHLPPPPPPARTPLPWQEEGEGPEVEEEEEEERNPFGGIP